MSADAEAPAPAADRLPRLGVVGGGQLARMLHEAALPLGLRLGVLAASDADPAVTAGAAPTIGSDADIADLRAFAADHDVVTFDYEGVDPDLLATLAAEGVVLRPGTDALLVAQDKLHQRRTLGAAGFPVPPWAAVTTVAEVEAFALDHGWPVVLKAPRGGYDGRGVAVVADASEAGAWLGDGGVEALVEPLVAIDREVAVLVARGPDGGTAVYPAVETVQHEAMLRELLAPAPVPEALAAEATDLARRIVDHVGGVGVVAVELFVTGGALVVNELALRPHNSAHHTIEGSVTSQFEQHVRATLGWPLGSVAATAPAAVTVNVVGPDAGSEPATRLAGALAVPGAHVHLYGKASRPGRKLGHVTVLGEDLEDARAVAWRAVRILEGTDGDAGGGADVAGTGHDTEDGAAR